jgi:hypothetical protein
MGNQQSRNRAAEPGETAEGNRDPDVSRFEKMMAVLERIANATVMMADCAQGIMVSQGRIENMNQRAMNLGAELLKLTGIDGMMLGRELATFQDERATRRQLDRERLVRDRKSPRTPRADI